MALFFFSAKKSHYIVKEVHYMIIGVLLIMAGTLMLCSQINKKDKDD